MKIKLNWGWAIVLFFILFITALLSFVVFTTTVHNDLVAVDYYEQQITYQQQIDKVKRTQKLGRQLAVRQGNDFLAITFPDTFAVDSIAGKIIFFRPDDAKKDFTIDILTDSNLRQVVSTKGLHRGLWKLRIDWAAGDSLYYNEEQIILR